MDRSLCSALAAAFLALGCGSSKDDTPAACGELGSFNLAGCPLSTLATLERQGAWNMNLHSDQAHSATSFSFLDPAGPTLHGLPAQLQHGADSFLISTEGVTNSGQQVRLAYAGCEASSPDAIRGKFAFCTNGAKTGEGAFEAKRIRRIAGETERTPNVSLVGEIGFSGARTADVFVAGTIAYVVLFESGAAIVDVSDRANPRLLARIPAPEDYWNAVWVKDNVLYLASAAKGLIFYDVTNPATPRWLGSLPEPPVNVHTLFLDGNTLFAMSPDPAGETLIFDVTDATLPSLRWRFQAAGANPAAARFPHDATALGGRLYINHWASGLVVADVSDPTTQPTELGRFIYPDATSHASQAGVIGGKTIVFEGGESWGAHLRVLDATDPEGITQIGRFSLRPEVSLHNLALRGTRLYVAWYQDGLRVFDVSVPASPAPVGYFNTWRESDPGRGKSFYDGAIGIRVPGDGFVYLADVARGLLIFAEPP
jgi:hypothetical protein